MQQPRVPRVTLLVILSLSLAACAAAQQQKQQQQQKPQPSKPGQAADGNPVVAASNYCVQSCAQSGFYATPAGAKGLEKNAYVCFGIYSNGVFAGSTDDSGSRCVVNRDGADADTFESPLHCLCWSGGKAGAMVAWQRSCAWRNPLYEELGDEFKEVCTPVADHTKDGAATTAGHVVDGVCWTPEGAFSDYYVWCDPSGGRCFSVAGSYEVKPPTWTKECDAIAPSNTTFAARYGAADKNANRVAVSPDCSVTFGWPDGSEEAAKFKYNPDDSLPCIGSIGAAGEDASAALPVSFEGRISRPMGGGCETSHQIVGWCGGAVGSTKRR